MSLGFVEQSPALVGLRPRTRSAVEHDPVRRVDRRTDGPSRTELAVEKVAGLVALATGVGLLAPLVVALQRDETDGVGAAVIAVLSGITLIAGVMLLLGSRPETDDGADDWRRSE